MYSHVSLLIPKKSDSHSPVRPNTLFDGSYVLLAIEKRLPGIQVSDSVKIAPRDVGVLF